jgi:hypothetical protein
LHFVPLVPIGALAMCSRTHRLLVVGLTLLCLRSTPISAQQAPASDAVAILDRVMNFRIFWLGDTTPLAACSAFTVLGRPADFPVRLSRYVLPLLDRDPSTCDRPPVQQSKSWCPIVNLEKITIADSVATVDLTVSRDHYRYRETYRATRYRMGNPRSSFPPRSIWFVDGVTLSGIATVHQGANPGDFAPASRVCPGHR